MFSKYGKWFPIFVFVIPLFISIFQGSFLYFWARGWFGDVSVMAPILAYIGIGLSLFFGLSAVVAVVVVARL